MKGYNHSISSRIAAVIFFAAVFMFFSAGAAFCQELTIPYVFSPGNVISSFEMNENFRVIADKANSLDSVINNLDASNSFWGYDSGTLTYSGGNVGIGTTSPVSPFTVAKNDGLAIDGAHILSTIYRGLGDNSNAGVSFGYFVTGGIQAAGYIRAEDDLPLMLGTIGAPQALTITDSGNVGIGTTSLSSKLHVYGGDISITGDIHPGIIFDEAGVENGQFQILVDNGQFSIRENGHSYDDIVFAIKNGNYGFGTGSPLLGLTVAGGEGENGVIHLWADEGDDDADRWRIENSVDGSLKFQWYRAGYWVDYMNCYEQRIKFNENNKNIIFSVDTQGKSNALYIDGASGYVGIWTQTPAYELDVNGDIQCVDLHQPSDIRYKSDIRTIPNALERVNNLRGVNFTWKDEEKFGSGKQIGIVAQEIEKVFPEAVTSDSEGNKSVTYSKLTAVLIEAVKEQQEQIEALEKRLEAVESR